MMEKLAAGAMSGVGRAASTNAINFGKGIVEKLHLKDVAEQIVYDICTEEYQDRVKENIIDMIDTCINKNKILELLLNPLDTEAITNDLIQAHAYYSESDRQTEEFQFYQSVIKKWVERISKIEELSKLVVCLKNNELGILLLMNIYTIENRVYYIENIADDFYKLLQSIDEKLNELLSGNAPIEKFIQCIEDSNPIKDQNQAYCDNFTNPFFLESEMDDDLLASLQHVYVHPQIKDRPQPIQEVLKEWCDANDPSSTQAAKRKRVFLLYGKAGIGKSSLTAYIITHKDEFFPNRPVHAIALRNHVQTISKRDSNQSAWDKVKACFQCTENSNYQNCVLILDGLDEVCVLASDFQGEEFLQFLCNSCPDNVKILITSRDGNYFQNINHNHLREETLLWTKEQMTEWCRQYSAIHTNRREWCGKFITAYDKLPADNKLKDIFCVPIILYICCVSEIDIEKHSSVASVYDEAFRKIAHREHQQNEANTFKDTDEEQFKIHWQYAKELAFQMFLRSRMEEELTTDAVAEAKRRTAALLGKDERDIANDCDKFFAIFHFASEQNQAVVFAHKTVWEYFTAVKLYEDYFAKMNTNDTVSVWKMIFQSFRYQRIPEDIMQYLVDLIKKKKENQIDEWKKAFFECYYDGMLKQQLWKVMTEPTDYSCRLFLPYQVAIAFRNLTWCLTMLDFRNDKDMEEEKWNCYKFVYATFFLQNVNMDINCSGWENLSNIWLRGANLTDADLTGTDLTSAHLNGADLRNTIWNSNSKLDAITIWESDLQKFDDLIEKYQIQLIDPYIIKQLEHENWIYNPKTNRLEPPEQESSH